MWLRQLIENPNQNNIQSRAHKRIIVFASARPGLRRDSLLQSPNRDMDRVYRNDVIETETHTHTRPSPCALHSMHYLYQQIPLCGVNYYVIIF